MLSTLAASFDFVTVLSIIIAVTIFFGVTLLAITRAIKALGETINYTREYDLMEHIVSLTSQVRELEGELENVRSGRRIQENQVELAEQQKKAAIAERDAALLRVHRLMDELQRVNLEDQ